MFACRGGLVEEEEGPRHSRVWEDEGRGGRRGKRWRTREEVEVEPLETSFNVTVHEECHGTATQIRARVAPIRVIQQTSKAE